MHQHHRAFVCEMSFDSMPITEPILREESKALAEGDGLVEDFFVVTKVTESELPISFAIKALEETAQIGRFYH